MYIAPMVMAAAPTVSPACMALSRFLSGRDTLNPKLGARVQSAWQERDGKLSADVDALWQWVGDEHWLLPI